VRWEPYNKDPSFLCGVPESAAEGKGYRVLAVHDTPSACANSVDPDHERLIERMASGLNLLDKLQHEIRNPVFAIETNLESMLKRIRDEIAGMPSVKADGLKEALVIADEIQSSLERIKAAITDGDMTISHHRQSTLAEILAGQKIEIVRSAKDVLELTLASTNPKVTLTIRGSFELAFFGDRDSVLPTEKIAFGS